MKGLPKVLDFFIGGFQLNNIVTLQSGPVFSVTAGGGRANIIGDPTPTAQQLAQGRRLNRAAFQQSTTRVFPGVGNSAVFGNLGRNTLRGPMQKRLDLGLSKQTRITETTSLELRVDAFNVFNFVNFANPNNVIGTAGTDFGFTTDTVGGPRVLQFGAKIRF